MQDDINQMFLRLARKKNGDLIFYDVDQIKIVSGTKIKKFSFEFDSIAANEDEQLIYVLKDQILKIYSFDFEFQKEYRKDFEKGDCLTFVNSRLVGIGNYLNSTKYRIVSL